MQMLNFAINFYKNHGFSGRSLGLLFAVVLSFSNGFNALALEREVDFAATYNGSTGQQNAEQQGFGIGYAHRWNLGANLSLGPALRVGQIASSLKRDQQAWNIDSRWVGLGPNLKYQGGEKDSFIFSIIGARSFDKARVDDNGPNYFRRVEMKKISSNFYEADLLYRHFFTDALHLSVGLNHRVQQFTLVNAESTARVELENPDGGYSLANDSALTAAQKAIVPESILIQSTGIVFGFGVSL